MRSLKITIAAAALCLPLFAGAAAETACDIAGADALGQERPLDLEECILRAIHNNPQILSSELSVRESEERIREVRSGFYPTINLTANADRFSLAQPGAGAGLPASTNLGAGISARYYLFQGWKTAAGVQAARYGLESTALQHETNLQDLIFRVSQAYYRLLQAEHLEGVAEQSVERARVHLEFAKARFEAGLAPRSDILKAEVEVSNAKLTLIRAKNGRLSLRGSLSVFLGREAGVPLRIVDDFGPPELSGGLDFDSLLGKAYERRPELKRMAAQLNIQKAGIRLARSDFYPWLSTDAGFNFSGTGLSAMNRGWSVGLSLSYPLFTGFARTSRVAQEEIAYVALLRQQEALKQQISLDVWNAYLSIKEAEERIDNARVFLDNARENLNIAEGEYKEGVGSMIEVIDAQTALVAAEESQIEALADHKIALAALDRVVGVKMSVEK
jgi:outer membrane protein TolC